MILVINIRDTLIARLHDDTPLLTDITDAALKSVLHRFITPKDQQAQPDLLTGNTKGFGEFSWIEDVIARDPALSKKPPQQAIEEVLLYPGLHALALHRVAHELCETHDPVLQYRARAISQAAKSLTGIEIHPGAEIGEYLFIDHGAGTIIGEQAVIGNHVKMYQGVTIGGDDKPLPDGTRRHPTIGDHVTLDTGAKVLGASHIGDHTRISSDAQIIGDLSIGQNVRITPDSTVRIDIPDNVSVVTDDKGWHTITHADGHQQSVNWQYRDRKHSTLNATSDGWVRTVEQGAGMQPTHAK